MKLAQRVNRKNHRKSPRWLKNSTRSRCSINLVIANWTKNKISDRIIGFTKTMMYLLTREIKFCFVTWFDKYSNTNEDYCIIIGVKALQNNFIVEVDVRNDCKEEECARKGGSKGGWTVPWTEEPTNLSLFFHFLFPSTTGRTTLRWTWQ